MLFKMSQIIPRKLFPLLSLKKLWQLRCYGSVVLASLLVAIVGMSASPTFGQNSVKPRSTFVSPTPQEDALFGNEVVVAGDVNENGHSDLFVGAPGENVQQVESAGAVYLIDGQTGNVLRSFHSPNPSNDGVFGAHLSAVEDVNGDDTKDLLVGAPQETVLGNEGAGRAYLFSGSNGKVLKQFAAPRSKQSRFSEYEGHFGASVASAGDINNDGIPDLLIGAPEETVEKERNSGSVYLFSGNSGDLLQRFSSPTPTQDLRFGSTISHLEGHGKSRSVLAVGIYSQSESKHKYSESLYFFSYESGRQVGSFDPSEENVVTPYGFSVTTARDVTGDGLDDLLLSSSSSSRVLLVDATKENILETYSPPQSNLSSFGDQVAPTGDVDGDGVIDILVSAPGKKIEDVEDAGRVYLLSGRGGDPIVWLSSPNATEGGSFGAAVATSINSDGSTDIFLGSDRENVPSNFDRKSAAGRAYYYRLDGKPLAALTQPDSPSSAQSDSSPSSAERQKEERPNEAKTSEQSLEQQNPSRDQEQNAAAAQSSSSQPVRVDANVPSTSRNRPNDIAVVIGNKEYQNPDIPDVDYAVRDARIMKKYLIRTVGFHEENIIYAENATAAKMTRIFGSKGNPKGKLYNWVKSNKSDVFVYYSGHGAPNPETGNAYFIPSNTNPSYLSQNGYSAGQLYENLAKIPAQSVTVVVEACFSGTSEGGAVVQDVSPAVLNVENPLVGMKNTLAFTAGAADQVSTWYNEKKHGLFTYYFLKGLRGAANSDGNSSIAAQEMKTYLRNSVPYRARRMHNREQTPQVIGQNMDQVLVQYDGKMPAQSQLQATFPATTTALNKSVENTLSLPKGARKVSSVSGAGELQKGDVILSVDGTKLDRENRLSEIVTQHSPGEELTLQVFREGSMKTLSVTLETAK